jgi:hypothetical protein
MLHEFAQGRSRLLILVSHDLLLCTISQNLKKGFEKP